MNITGILFIVVPLAGIVTLLFLPEIKAGLIRWWRRADAPVAAPESAPQQLRIYTRDGVVGVLPLRVAGFTLVVEDSKGGQKVINVGTAVDADAFAHLAAE